MIENMEKMIAGSLGLEEPWYVEKAEFHEEEPAIHICVGVQKTAQFVCPKCGGTTVRYGYEDKERVWRHGDCMFYPTYIHCRRPRIQCPHCGVIQLNAPFERSGSRFTLMFEGYAMLLLESMPVARAARVLRCDEKSLTNIMKYWVKKADSARDLSETTSIAIDETSNKKGHDYVTLVIDAATRAVIDVEEGKDKSTVEKFKKKLEKQGGKAESIETVTGDMSKAFLSGVEGTFPNANYIIDKFHVKQILIKALDEVRIAEQRESEDKRSLFLGRRLFMIPEHRMTDDQKTKFTVLSSKYRKTGKAYQIIASFDDFYASNSLSEAEAKFNALYSWMRRCRLEPMKKAALSLREHKDKILTFFKHHLTNAICEGINSIVQAAKRRARGFHTFEGFACAIYLAAGKLKLAVPSPF